MSRRVAELEATVGEAPFARTSLGVTPTSFGERLLEPARRMAEWSAEADRVAERAERAETTPRGTVRITAPPGIAFDFVAPFAAWMTARLPDVTLEVISSIAYLDLAPAYAETLPKRPPLGEVRWVAWAPPFEHLPPNPELTRAIPGFRPSFASDDFLVPCRAVPCRAAPRRAAEAGLGAIFLGRVEHRLVRAPKLVELDVDVGAIPRTLYLVGARAALEIPRVRAVAELLAAELHAATRTKKKRR